MAAPPGALGGMADRAMPISRGASRRSVRRKEEKNGGIGRPSVRVHPSTRDKPHRLLGLRQADGSSSPGRRRNALPELPFGQRLPFDCFKRGREEVALIFFLAAAAAVFVAAEAVVAVVADRLSYRRAVREYGTKDLVPYFCAHTGCGARHWTPRLPRRHNNG